MQRAVAVAVVLCLVMPPPLGGAQGSGCPDVVGETFASAPALRDLNARIAGFGVRSTASTAHRRTIDWLERELPPMRIRSQRFEIERWQSLGGFLFGARPIPIAGPIPYTAPKVATGELVRLTGPITAANAGGKVVLRDFPPVDRGYLAEPALDRDLVDAGLAGAVGVVVALPFPRDQMRGYWDPHTGTHYRVPGVFIGSDERPQPGSRVTIGVLGWRDRATTRSLIATLPGLSRERVVLDTNTDGNTWVQENGNAALLALTHYFARLPLRCRPRTLEFVFATGHLHRSAEGTEFRARALDAAYDSGSVAFAMTVEHLGTRELLPVNRRLAYTGAPELSAWFAGSPVLTQTANQAIARRSLDRTFVLPGIDAPDPNRAPRQCSFGGLGTHFHSHLIPSMGMISGPWSLWAPAFGEQAVDPDRMRRQAMAAGDTILALGTVPREQIAGPYLGYRKARANGAPTCPHDLPPEHAP